MTIVTRSVDALAVKIIAEHLAVKEAAKVMIYHAMDCGDLLIEAKAEVLHGEWLHWLAKECGDVSERMAQHYMRIARHRAEIESLDPKYISDLTFTGVLRLIGERDDDAYDGPKIVSLNEYRKPEPPPQTRTVISSVQYVKRPGENIRLSEIPYVSRPGENIRLSEIPYVSRPGGNIFDTPYHYGPEPEPEPEPEPSPAELERAASDIAWNVFRGVHHLRRILDDADPKTIAANMKYDDDPHAAQREALNEAQACIQWLTDFAESLRQIIPAPEAKAPDLIFSTPS